MLFLDEIIYLYDYVFPHALFSSPRACISLSLSFRQAVCSCSMCLLFSSFFSTLNCLIYLLLVPTLPPHLAIMNMPATLPKILSSSCNFYLSLSFRPRLFSDFRRAISGDLDPSLTPPGVDGSRPFDYPAHRM